MAYLLPTGVRKTDADTPVLLIPTAWFDAHPDIPVFSAVILQNLGNADIYILSNSSEPDTTNYLNVLVVIPAGEKFIDASHMFNDVDVRNVYMAPATNQDPLLVTVKVS